MPLSWKRRALEEVIQDVICMKIKFERSLCADSSDVQVNNLWYVSAVANEKKVIL